MKLQDKLQEIKDEVAVKHGYKGWYGIIWDIEQFDNITIEFVEMVENEAIIAFAKYCCERQRESDAEAAETKTVNPGYMEWEAVDKSSILNNTLITDEL